MRFLSPAMILALAGLLPGSAGASDTDPLLFEYDRRSDGIAAEIQPALPRLRIYESGRLLVHYPFYMKRAGLWEGHLTPGELQDLLDGLEAHGVFSIDDKELQQAVTVAQRRQAAQTGLLTYRSETVATVFRAHPGAKTIDGHELVVHNLQSRARNLPVPALDALAAAESELLDLCRSEALVRIADAEVPEVQR